MGVSPSGQETFPGRAVYLCTPPLMLEWKDCVPFHWRTDKAGEVSRWYMITCFRKKGILIELETRKGIPTQNEWAFYTLLRKLPQEVIQPILKEPSAWSKDCVHELHLTTKIIFKKFIKLELEMVLGVWCLLNYFPLLFWKLKLIEIIKISYGLKGSYS